jgi:hypothetical protein
MSIMRLFVLLFLLENSGIVASSDPAEAVGGCKASPRENGDADQQQQCQSPQQGQEQSQPPPHVDSTKLQEGMTIYTIHNPHTPSNNILVIDDFLDANFMSELYRNLSLSTDWIPVIPDHQAVFNYTRDVVESNTVLWTPPTVSDVGLPGLRHKLTQAYQDALTDKLLSLPNLEEIFQMQRSKIDPSIPALYQIWDADNSFFGNICYSPESLGILQRVPHVDTGLVQNPNGSFESLTLALIHYLSPDYTGTGGTSFYEQRASNSSRFTAGDCDKLQKVAKMNYPVHSEEYRAQMSCYCDKRGAGCREFYKNVPSGSYHSDSSQHFELVLHIPYQYNRVVLYSAKQLHTLHIDQVNTLSCHAAKGRLTTNLFMI